MSYKVLDKPLSVTVLWRAVKAAEYVEGVIALNLADVMAGDDEAFLNLISTRLTGSDALYDVEWEIVKGFGSTIHLRVSGNPCWCVTDEQGFFIGDHP